MADYHDQPPPGAPPPAQRRHLGSGFSSVCTNPTNKLNSSSSSIRCILGVGTQEEDGDRHHHHRAQVACPTENHALLSPPPVGSRSADLLLDRDSDSASDDTSVSALLPVARRGNYLDAVVTVPAFHCHQPRPGVDRTAMCQLSVVSLLCALFMAGEIIGGTIANSLSLISDASHLASDLMGFIVSLFAVWIGSKPPTARMSFGFYRAEVLSALISVLIIWVTTGVLVYLAVQRVLHQEFQIEADAMLATAGAGVVFNIVMGLVLNLSTHCGAVAHAHGHGHAHGGHVNSTQGHHQNTPVQGHPHTLAAHGPQTPFPEMENAPGVQNGGHLRQEDEEEEDDMVVAPFGQNEANRKSPKKDVNINVRAAFIHVIGDLIQSTGVFVAALVIKFNPELKLADPICTFIFSVLVLITTVTILRDALAVILEAVPFGLDYRMCKFDIETLEGVKGVHSLNVWTLTTGKNIVSVHLVVDQHTNRIALLEKSTLLLREKYHAFHTTVQMDEYDPEVVTSCEDCIGPRLS